MVPYRDTLSPYSMSCTFLTGLPPESLPMRRCCLSPLASGYPQHDVHAPSPNPITATSTLHDELLSSRRCTNGKTASASSSRSRRPSHYLARFLDILLLENTSHAAQCCMRMFVFMRSGPYPRSRQYSASHRQCLRCFRRQ